MMSRINRISMKSKCAAKMLAHADRAYPKECVGFLAGVGTTVTMVVPLTNSEGEKSFFVEPYEQYLAEKKIKEKKLELIAIYHSHPRGCACLSQTDLHFAKRWDCIQVVIAKSERDPNSGLVKAFRVAKRLEAPTEISITVD
jgi:proteasome lid subunit RPN8/RPN11